MDEQNKHAGEEQNNPAGDERNDLTGIEIIVFEDEDGFEIEMEIVDEFDFEGVHYVALTEAVTDLESLADDEDDDIINFFSISQDENEEETYDLIEDQKLLAKLYDLLEERLLADNKEE